MKMQHDLDEKKLFPGIGVGLGGVESYFLLSIWMSLSRSVGNIVNSLSQEK